MNLIEIIKNLSSLLNSDLSLDFSKKLKRRKKNSRKT